MDKLDATVDHFNYRATHSFYLEVQEHWHFSFLMVVLIAKACWISCTVMGVGEHKIQPRSLRALSFRLLLEELMREKILSYLLLSKHATVQELPGDGLRCVEILRQCSKFIFNFRDVVQWFNIT